MSIIYLESTINLLISSGEKEKVEALDLRLIFIEDLGIYIATY